MMRQDTKPGFHPGGDDVQQEDCSCGAASTLAAQQPAEDSLPQAGPKDGPCQASQEIAPEVKVAVGAGNSAQVLPSSRQVTL
jgi:hypothetical protein